MAREELDFEFWGFKKTSGFKPLDQLQPGDYYPSGQSNPKTERLIDAIIAILGRPSGE